MATAGADEPSLPPLVWAADAEGGEPYIFQNPEGDLEGFEVELARALETRLGRRIEFQQYQFGSLVSGLERGDFDLAMNGLEVTPDRLERVRFSQAYYVYRLQLVVRADDARLASLDDCRERGAVVGTLEDTAAERLLKQSGIEQRVYDSQFEPYNDLRLGRIDAVLLDLPIAAQALRKIPGLKAVGQSQAAGFYAIAFRKEDEELAARFDDAIRQLLASGDLERIYRRWGMWNDDQQALGNEAALAGVIKPVSNDWRPRRYLPLLLRGAVVTVGLSVASMILAIVLALPIALARLYGPRPLRWLAVGYVEFFRGIPVLLLLYFLYYGLPVAGQAYGFGNALKLAPLTAALLGFGLNYAAYEAEIYRAGIGSIPIGQWEAAASLGMSRPMCFRRIILPQAIRVILPPMTNDFIALFKDTSIVSVIAVVELTKQYQMVAKSSFKYLEIGLATAALYLVMSVPLGWLSRYLERRWGKGH